MSLRSEMNAGSFLINLEKMQLKLYIEWLFLVSIGNEIGIYFINYIVQSRFSMGE